MKGFALKLMREPLVLFLVLGTAVFALDGLKQQYGGTGSDTQIEITAGDITRLRAIWIAQRGSPPTADELRVLVEDHIREEILNREALRLGLDREDVIIRRRLAQKMTFLMEDRGALANPDEAALREFFNAHARRYERPATTTFEHVYFSGERPGGDATAEAEQALRRLRTTAAGHASGRGLGDPFLSGAAFSEQTRPQIAGLFGESFAGALEGLALDQWSGSVPSAYGLHLVRVSARQPPRLPDFGQVRDRVLEDYRAEQRQNANRAIYDELRQRYQVRMADDAMKHALRAPAEHESIAQ